MYQFKTVVTGRPEFDMEVPPALIKVLSWLAERHYDFTCKDAARYGGFIYGWKNQAELEGLDPITIHATWRQLDLSRKVCEIAQYGGPLTPGDMDLVVRFLRSAHRAMSLAGEQDWTLTLDSVE